MSEWTVKIQDVRRQLDAKEDADQKRLEEEIAASRLARQRRSRGIGSNSLDLSNNKEFSSALPSLRSEDTTSADHPKPLTERQKSQTDALNKLTGSASNPSSNATHKPQPMSLAAFIGGKATGPRLNRHAPQQDAHDPTQFVQRTRIDAPHPIFGRGGIAMPGMTARSSVQESDHPTGSASSRSGRTSEARSRRLSTPSPEKPETQPISSQTTVRERTISSPTGATMYQNRAPQPTRAMSSSSESQPKTSSLGNNFPIPSTSRPFTPRREPSPSNPPLSKSPVVTPSLVRTIQPDPRTSPPQGPQISISQSPSLAFMRPPSQKEPTPSLSRLQGRGFVQNMVKVSAQLESPNSSPGSADKHRPASERKSSVLDRWTGPTVSPPPSPTSAPIRRSRTMESAPAAQTTPVPLSKSYSDRSRAKVDEPVPTSAPAPRLGSASTVVFQPENFGVDEHGFKVRGDPPSRPSTGSATPEPAKSLIHPTKDRAKKPKKNKAVRQDPGQNSTPSSLSVLSVGSSTSLARAPSPSGSNGAGDSGIRSSPAIPPKPVSEPSSTNGSGMIERKAFLGMTSPPIISPKPVLEPNQPSLVSSASSSGMARRRALPGMTSPNSIPSISPKPISTSVLQSNISAAPRPLPGLAPASTSQQENASFHVPVMHTRIPSTGNRPTIMEVAQALADPPPKLSPIPPAPLLAEDQPAEIEPVPTPRPRSTMSQSAQAEKRKSNYERYSVVLPPLKEEATPDATPVSTLTRAVRNSFVQPDFDLLDSKMANHMDNSANSLGKVELTDEGESEMVHFTHSDEPLPIVDVSPFTRYKPHSSSKDLQTIQVDVMSIAGSTAVPLGLAHIFHDTEILAIIYRAKSNSTGLISSTVWSWQGKSSSLGSSEEHKLAELAKRYGTSVVPIRQLYEPAELVQCLGGTLAIRQGSRTHWTNENTAMHVVRAIHGVIFIDQVDLDVKSVCSGFSYCVSIFETLYVWHGRGSPAEEREAALHYARTLTSSPEEIVILIENENDDDEMFWMALGEEVEYAKAHYWRWRPSISVSPRIWSVDAGRNAISHVPSFSHEKSPHTSVYIMDCVFELFVLVPSLARGSRRDIRFALLVATALVSRLASARPYTPNVHVIILPSQIPVDLRIQFRDLEETFFNDTHAIEHMNILTDQEAQAHLQTASWTQSRLKDKNLLPLGLDGSQIYEI
ncbi:hypothetical protein GGX14DRAFT_357559 [Mycena pura]|uniref:Gelsolin-like domain-containing protein n=1 Tax=Mycena pura TaxID=153505 RepID=A0AAD6VRL4_9AGAR|nr:hypothetical protein GGX14DRAFT_357559 [Mycena pura]